MTTSGIVLGHVVPSKGIKVDKIKVEVILKLLSPKIIDMSIPFQDMQGFIGDL